MKQVAILTALTVCTFGFMESAEAASAYTTTTGRGRYVVAASGGLNVRSIPSTYGRRTGRLANGRELYVYGIGGSWARFYYNGKRSFVHKGYIRRKTTTSRTSTTPRRTTPSRPPTTTSSHPARTSRAGAGTYTVAASGGLNVRSGPGTGYGKVGRLANGARITVYGIGGDWARFRHSSGTRYVHKGYVRRASSAPSTPSRSSTPTTSVDTRARTTTAGRGTYEATTAGSVRLSPSARGTRVGALTRGRRYTVYGVSTRYARLRFGSATRYVFKSFLKKVSSGSTAHPAYTTTAGRGTHYVRSGINVPVRSGPGTSFSQLGRRTGSVYVHGKARGWARVTYSGRRAFMSTASLTTTRELPGVPHTLRYEVSSPSSVVRSGPSSSDPIVARLGRGVKITASRRSGSYIGYARAGRLGWVFQSTVKTVPETNHGSSVTRRHYKPKATTTLRVRPGGPNTNVRVYRGSHVYSLRSSNGWLLVEFLNRPAGWIRERGVEQTIDTTRPAYTARRSNSDTWSRGNSDFALGVDGNTTVTHSRSRASGYGRMQAFVKVFGKKVPIATMRSSVAGTLGGNVRTLNQDGIRIISVLGDSPFSHGNTISLDYSIAENVFGVKPEFRVPLLGIPVRVAFDATVSLSLSSERQTRGGGWDASSSISVSAGISGEIGVDVFVAGAGVGGEVSATAGPSIDFELRPNAGSSSDLGVGASVGGRVYLYGRIGKGFLSYTEDVTLLSYTLASTRATLARASATGN